MLMACLLYNSRRFYIMVIKFILKRFIYFYNVSGHYNRTLRILSAEFPVLRY